jgi:hypothetical protein
MKLPYTITLAVALITLGVQATPMPNPEADPLITLDKRADNWCRVATNGVDCRSQPGVGAGTWIRDIQINQLFGVRCTRVVGGRYDDRHVLGSNH